ncbi:MAG: beta-propeller fold lactonase family protein [Solirubrobacterales bacterium]|nr:beta-propeller fold lactonase family protein [Solirubrobacterales bacterium]
MADITRRHLLGSAAAGAGGAIASGLLGSPLARAAAAGPRKGSIKDVKHVVVHMQENRSFDHYFGTLAGVRGFGDPNVGTQDNGKSLFYQPDPQNPDGYLLPWHLDTKSTSSQAIPSTSHAWAVQHQAMNISVGSTPGAPTTAKNNQWLPAHLKADGNSVGPYTMGYYEREDIPFHFALAETFTLCDAYFCSLLGPTWPNRMYLMTGMIDPTGSYGGPIVSNVVPSPTTGEPYSWTTYPERLTKAGISWRIYQEEDDYGTNMLEFFQAFQNAKPGSPLYENGLTIHPPDRFEWDVKHNKLPTVSWIVPSSGQSEHPAYIPAAGADYLASKLNAVAANKDIWNSTVFVINYDENDGLFDHVIPPLPPAGTAHEFVDGVPIGGGIRVPAFIVSPWTVGGYVATENFDHTSVLQLLEQVTGVREANISDWRRQTFGDLTSALGFSHSSTKAPKLPATIGEFWTAETQTETKPPATFPGANQTPPTQEKVRPAWKPQSPSVRDPAVRNALPATRSRLNENRTTHLEDFRGGSDKVLLARLDEVSGKAVKHTATAQHFLAYVPGVVGDTIAIIDGPSRALASAITEGTTDPYGAVVAANGTELWVTESGTNYVSVWNTGNNELIENVLVGVYPHGIAVSPDTKTVYVANTGPNTGKGGSEIVSVVDVSARHQTHRVVVGQAPQTLAASPSGGQVVVTCADGVYAFSTRSLKAHKSPQAFSNPHGVAITPSGKHIWVTDSENNRVVVLDSTHLKAEKTIKVGNTPWCVTFDQGAKKAYVTNINDDTVSVIDTKHYKVINTIKLGSFPVTNTVTKGTYTQLHHQPGAIATAPDGSIWVASNSSSSIAVIDPSSEKVTSSLELGLGDDPTGIAFVRTA